MHVTRWSWSVDAAAAAAITANSPRSPQKNIFSVVNDTIELLLQFIISLLWTTVMHTVLSHVVAQMHWDYGSSSKQQQQTLIVQCKVATTITSDRQAQAKLRL